MNNYLSQFLRSEDFCNSLYHIAKNQVRRRANAYRALAIFEVEDLYNEIIIALDSAPCFEEQDMIDYAYRFCERLAKNGNDKLLTQRRRKKNGYKRYTSFDVDVLDLTQENENGEFETDDEVMARLVHSGKGKYIS